MYVSTFLLNRIMPTRSLININEFSVTEDIRNKPLIACLYSKLYYSISNIGKLNQLQEKGISGFIMLGAWSSSLTGRTG